MTRSTIVKPYGLVTEPNQYGQFPDGALRQALNVCMRRAGILEPFPAFDGYLGTPADAGYTFKRLWPAATGLFGVAANGAPLYALLRVAESGTTPVSIPELTLSVAPGKAHMATHRGRYYFTSEQGVLAMASQDASSATLAGFPPPQSIEVSDMVTFPAQAVQDDRSVAYRALFSRQEADGSFSKIGPPSYAVQVDNEEGSVANIELRIGFSDAAAGNLAEGDRIELYRTVSQEIGTDPGATFLLAAVYTLDATDIANGFALVMDMTPDSGLGAALYTNPNEEGASAAKYPPPLADDLHVFKTHMFYVAPKVAGHLSARVPGKWGVLTTSGERAFGIGVRPQTAQLTSGSATVGLSHISGIVPGQLVDDKVGGAIVPAGTTVLSVDEGLSTIVMSANALSTEVDQLIDIIDRIEVNGTVVTAANPQAMVLALNEAGSDAIFTFSQTLRSSGLDPLEMEGLEFRIDAAWYAFGVPTLRATNGQNYDPHLPDLDEPPLEGTQEERSNRLLWSEQDQPEAVPLGNELLVGAGTIHRIMATTDALYAFCSDGLYRVSGFAPDWRADPIDPTLVLAARNSLDIARQTIWARTNRGLVALSEGAGVVEMSSGVIAELAGVYEDTWGRWLTCDESTSEVWVFEAALFVGSIAYVFNTLTRGFTSALTALMATPGQNMTASTYVPSLPGIVFGNSAETGAELLKFHASTKCDAVVVTHQPITGDGDPFVPKMWIDCAWLMRVPSSALSLLPTMNGIEFPADVTVSIPQGTNNTLDSRGVAAILRSAAYGPSLEVGWRLTANATQAWQFRGLSLRYMIETEQGVNR